MNERRDRRLCPFDALAHGLLDWRIGSIRPIKQESLGRNQRWLSHKTGNFTLVCLRCVHQKRMAKVDGSDLSVGQFNGVFHTVLQLSGPFHK